MAEAVEPHWRVLRVASRTANRLSRGVSLPRFGTRSSAALDKAYARLSAASLPQTGASIVARTPKIAATKRQTVDSHVNGGTSAHQNYHVSVCEHLQSEAFGLDLTKLK